jgi:YVTN family beta-propeller protein
MSRFLRRISILVLIALQGCGGGPTTENKTTPQLEPTGSQQKPAGYRVYVTNESSGDMSVIDPATNTVIATIPLGKRPRGIHASPDRKTIYVALSGSPMAPPGVDESTLPPADKKADGIGVFDVPQNKLLKVISGGSDPEEFSMSKDGRLLYISNEDIGGASIVDVAKGTVIETLKVGEEPEGVETTPDGKFVYVTSEDDGAISVIDTASGKVIKSFKVGLRPRKVAFLPDSSKAYVTRENDGAVSTIDVAKHQPIRSVQLGKAGDIRPMAVIVSRDGKQAYVSTGRGKKVFVINTATDEVTGSFEVGERPWGIALSPDGKFLFSANGPSNDVSVVDLSTQTVVTKIKVGDRPWGVIALEP